MNIDRNNIVDQYNKMNEEFSNNQLIIEDLILRNKKLTEYKIQYEQFVRLLEEQEFDEYQKQISDGINIYDSSRGKVEGDFDADYWLKQDN